MKNLRTLFGCVLLSLAASCLGGGWASAQAPMSQTNPVPGSPVPQGSADVSRFASPGFGGDGGVNLGGSARLAVAGDAAAAHGDADEAKRDYQQALAMWPNNPLALYGMAKISLTAGDTTAAIGDFRAAIYRHVNPPMQPTIQEASMYRLMEYVLLLSRAGQSDEALAVYRYAAAHMNYRDGKQYLHVLLPEFSPGDPTPTPRQLQAMAHVGIAIDHGSFDYDAALSHLQQAITLAPKSPIPHFYRAKHLSIFPRGYQDAPGEYEKARRLGDAQVGTAVEKAVKNLP